ncbi:uncharacterized protein KQ657_002853 [Scheffersomyces spartinae]|uniref:ATP-dependent RNA helicase n=1 Tax=Scheffersomyces spartinae TaxID=45513 RepID=A0A9P7V5M2_9ASCO|nr:uncharacterized protein KQ657_002853 [Scheffersomyces spartinae]KAG7191717.1 hypothetical protein KQ657_002853 [Scheffersomyces spartinae]
MSFIKRNILGLVIRSKNELVSSKAFKRNIGLFPISRTYSTEGSSTEASTVSDAETVTTPVNSRIVSDMKSLKKNNLISADIVDSMIKAKFEHLTPVQQKSIIPILESEKGLVVRAKTGTGKTLAFVIPTLDAAIKRQGPPKTTSLIVAPTRDLAQQIVMEYKKVIQFLPRSLAKKCDIGIIMGGNSTKKRPDPRNPPAIIVATPGRLADQIRSPSVSHMFSELEYRVYDEADRILDEGFRDEIDSINDRLIQARRHNKNEKPFKSVCYSATIANELEDFAVSEFGAEYEFVDCVDKNEPEAHENIHQELVYTNDAQQSFNAAASYIVNEMERKNFKAIVFLPTVTGCDWFFKLLRECSHSELYDSRLTKKFGSRTLRLNGKMTQVARDRSVREFRSTSHGVLVATDVAARGMDFSDVTDVIQIAPSTDMADYVHKIGRTARAGRKGKATLFLSKLEAPYSKKLISSKKINFANKLNAEEVPEFSKDILSTVKLPMEDVEEFANAYLSFRAQCSAIYKIDKYASIKETLALYRTLVDDPEAKLSASENFLKNIFQLSRDEAEPFFHLPSGYRGPQRKSFNNQNKSSARRGRFDSNRGGNYQRLSGGYGSRDSYKKRNNDDEYRTRNYDDFNQRDSFKRRSNNDDFRGSNKYNSDRKNYNKGTRDNFGSRRRNDHSDEDW